MEKKEEYATKSQLKESGWTDTMVKKFLGTPDATKTNPYYKCAAPMGLYDMKRVKRVERTKAFKEAMAKSEARKAAAEKAVVTKRRKEFEQMERAEQERCRVEQVKRDFRKKLRKVMKDGDVKDEGKLKAFLHDLAMMNGMLAKGWGVRKSEADELCYEVKQECIEFLVKERPDRCFYANADYMSIVYVYAGGRQYSFHCSGLSRKPRYAPKFGVCWDEIEEGWRLSDAEYKERLERRRSTRDTRHVASESVRKKCLELRSMLREGGDRIAIYKQRMDVFFALLRKSGVRHDAFKKRDYAACLRMHKKNPRFAEYTQFEYVYGFDVFPNEMVEKALRAYNPFDVHSAINRFYGLNEANYVDGLV